MKHFKYLGFRHEDDEGIENLGLCGYSEPLLFEANSIADILTDQTWINKFYMEDGASFDFFENMQTSEIFVVKIVFIEGMIAEFEIQSLEEYLFKSI